MNYIYLIKLSFCRSLTDLLDKDCFEVLKGIVPQVKLFTQYISDILNVFFQSWKGLCLCFLSSSESLTKLVCSRKSKQFNEIMLIPVFHLFLAKSSKAFQVRSDFYLVLECYVRCNAYHVFTIGE